MKTQEEFFSAYFTKKYESHFNNICLDKQHIDMYFIYTQLGELIEKSKTISGKEVEEALKELPYITVKNII